MNNEINQVLDRMCPICLNRNDIREMASGLTCDKCLHAWRHEPWKDMDITKHFENAYYTKPEPPELLNVHIRLFERFEKLASEAVHGKNRLMLDFGCSCGNCMEIFKKNKWDVFGIEIAPNSQKILTEKNLRWAPTLQESGLKYGSVDTIIMADCIYYLPDPVQILSEMRKYLTPQGILILRQPTRAGLARFIKKLLGNSQIIYSLWGDYIHLFSRRSTVLALKRAGFSYIDILKERQFVRTFRNKIVHQVLYFNNLITFGHFDLTLSWTICARPAPPINRRQFIIAGENITIRHIKFSDALDILKAIQDNDVAKWAAPFDQQLIHNYFLRRFYRLSRYTYKILRYMYQRLIPPHQKKIFRFGISLNQTNRIVGMVILSRQGPQLEVGDIGFWIIKKYWGQGLTTQAVKLAIEFGFNHLGLETIEGWTVKENIGSQKVMQKCGFKLCSPEKKADMKSADTQKLTFRILRSEYNAHAEDKFIEEQDYAD
ncbi:MAG: GNAT family N-acetyltransferase [Phycisphaerae bacterium]